MIIFPVDYVIATNLQKHVPIIKISSLLDVTLKPQQKNSCLQKFLPLGNTTTLNYSKYGTLKNAITRDFHRWYNNKYVEPTLEAIKKLIQFYHDKGIDML